MRVNNSLLLQKDLIPVKTMTASYCLQEVTSYRGGVKYVVEDMLNKSKNSTSTYRK